MTQIKYFWRLRRKDYYQVAFDIKKTFPELVNLYIEDIESRLRNTSLEFYYTEKTKSPIWIRLTLPLAFIAIIMLFSWLPMNYIITGYWGYRFKPLTNWLRSLGF